MSVDSSPSRLPASDARRKRLRRLADNGAFSDIKLVVGPHCEVIPTARAFLAAASDVFETMLTSTMVEGQHGAEIAIPDLEPAGVRSIINYGYSGETEVSEAALVSSFAAARKYEVHDLTDACLAAIKALPASAVLTVLDAATRTGEDEIISTCQCSLSTSEKISEALSSSAVASLSEAGMQQLLQIEACHQLPAHTLWEACKRWARQNAGDGEQWRLRCVALAPLLPTKGLTLKYLATLVEEGLLGTSCVVALLRDLSDVMPLMGTWRVQDASRALYIITSDCEGKVVLSMPLPSIEERFRLEGRTLEQQDGWFVFPMRGHECRIRLKQVNADTLETEISRNGRPWSLSVIAKRDFAPQLPGAV